MTILKFPLCARFRCRRTLVAASSWRRSAMAAQASRTTPARIRFDLGPVLCLQVPNRVPFGQEPRHAVEQGVERLPILTPGRFQTHAIRQGFHFESCSWTPAEPISNGLGDHDLSLAGQLCRISHLTGIVRRTREIVNPALLQAVYRVRRQPRLQRLAAGAPRAARTQLVDSSRDALLEHEPRVQPIGGDGHRRNLDRSDVRLGRAVLRDSSRIADIRAASYQTRN
jgi:hypothetical protein